MTAPDVRHLPPRPEPPEPDNVRHLPAPARAGGRRVVASPDAPMRNAALFLDDVYPVRDGQHQLVLHGGAFYRFDGGCWTAVEDHDLRSRLYRFFDGAVYEVGGDDDQPKLRPWSPNRNKVTDLIDALRGSTFLSRTVVAPSWLGGGGPAPAHETVACANGLLHWPSRTLHPHTPRFYVHHAVPFAYDAAAPRPERWERFLRELWPDDPEAIEALQEIFGYLLSGSTTQHKMFLLVGPPRSGKGTIGRVLTALIGHHHVAGPTLAGLATNFGLQTLIGKPVAIVADARLRSGQDAIVERLLSISGEDFLTVDRKYQEPWTGKLPSRFVILTNELPRLSDTSGALASRFVVLTMTRSWYGHEDTGLTDDLLAELPGILGWALDGLERLRERGRFEPPASSEEAVRELEDLASPVGAFLRDECQLGPAHSCPVPLLYLRWQQWSRQQGSEHVTTRQTFGRDLRAALPQVRVEQVGSRRDRERRYVGVGIREGGPQ